MAVKALKSTIEEYSLKKKNTKGTEECSVKKPPTSSDSKITIIKTKYNLSSLLCFTIYSRSALLIFLM